MKIHSKSALALSLLAGFIGAPSQSVRAAVVAPDYCSSSTLLNFGIGAVFNDKGAYCVSSFGWSDTWYSIGVNETFPPFPGQYDQATDLFSGDDSPNLRFRDEFGALLSGTGWLSPIMDAGVLSPFYLTNSAWQVITDLEYVGSGTDTLRSTIGHNVGDGTLEVVITTHLNDSGVLEQTFDIVNKSSIILTDVFFSDYFNFHPNGSSPAATQLGTTTFDGTQINTIGDSTDTGFVGNGHMALAQNGQPIVPDAHSVGTCNGPVNPGDPPCISLISEVENGSFNGVNQAGPGDTVGTLGKALGQNATFCTETSGNSVGVLCPNEQASITVVKTVPEPGSLLLILAGAPMVWMRARRGRKTVA